MRRVLFQTVAAVVFFGGPAAPAASVDIPRAEHPTPDAVRAHWMSLNGTWEFRFDPRDEGLKAGWETPGASGFDRSIVVPFPWESELSGIKDTNYHGVAWYRRTVQVPDNFPAGERIWLRFGAVDWRADVWVNGHHVARHEGGYTPFEADITDALKREPGEKTPAVVVVRVDDPTDPSLPTGKQVFWYTTTSGIWQTVWLESRPKAWIKAFTVTTEIAPARVRFVLELAGVGTGEHQLVLRSDDSTVGSVTKSFQGADATDGALALTVEADVKDPKLWTPETPHLYHATLELKAGDSPADAVKTYFGLRTITRGKYGDAPYERLLLNGKPVYLRAALDQSFNPKGIYTAPDDDFLKRDMLIAKANGLNGLRIHIKPDEPRRLFWADTIGLLILEDMPNTWQQNAKARHAWEATMREAIARDRNHPSIIAWVAFNETWGLGSPPSYKKDRDTQAWVGRMVEAIRKLDPTRLVEDNSPCNYDHVENTDLNSWHFYIDDHQAAEQHITEVVEKARPGSEFNYCPGLTQGTAPLINSEYGGVSSGGGDRDVSWSFRDLTTLLRRQPKIQGYVYTELTDVEWEHNGFVNYDRSPKEFGYDEFVPDMRPNELNGADFIGYGSPPVLVVKTGEKVKLPWFISHYSERKGPPRLRWWATGWDDEANLKTVVFPETRPASWKPYDVSEQEPLTFQAPDRPLAGAVLLTLRDENDRRIAANFVNLVVRPDTPRPRAERKNAQTAVLRIRPDDLAVGRWSGGWSSPPGKVFGRGAGAFEYRIKVPAAVVQAKPSRYFLRFEAGSRADKAKVDWPGHDNPQDYPQTDLRKWPTTLSVSLNGQELDRQTIVDDPADARGVLSHQKGYDHGSYGELIELEGQLPQDVRDDLAAGKPLVLRLSVPEGSGPVGGLSLYGSETGQYPFDMTLELRTEEDLPEDLGVKAGEPLTLDRLADRRSVVLEAGDGENSTEWAYTMDDPGTGWTAPDFDAASWARGKAGFGTPETPALKIGTRWNSGRIWLRTTVDLPGLASGDSLTLRLFHDEDAEVFVNGRSLLRLTGFLSAYRDVPLTPEQKALFHPGRNTIAVNCRQTQGGQGIDVGLTWIKED